MFDIIAFDADDTLWHNESLFSLTQEKFKHLLAPYHPAAGIEQKLYETELRNIPSFGYGIKSFTLSMIETAIELSGGQIQGREVQEIINLAKSMRQAEVQLLEYAEETVALLSTSHDLMIITKGDLFDQETKIARSGLTQYFKYIEIVSEKTDESYRALLSRYNIKPYHFLMVGNSLKSDILPVIAIGGQAVYIPHHLTWAHEIVKDLPPEQPSYFELAHLGQLPALVTRLNHA